MSLAVPPDLLKQARRGEVEDEAFPGCVRSSLPYAWAVVTVIRHPRLAPVPALRKQLRTPCALCGA
jgi:hypothetical protein